MIGGFGSGLHACCRDTLEQLNAVVFVDGDTIDCDLCLETLRLTDGRWSSLPAIETMTQRFADDVKGDAEKRIQDFPHLRPKA